MRTDNARIIRVCEGTKDEGRTKRRDSHRLYRHRPDVYTPSVCHPRTEGITCPAVP